MPIMYEVAWNISCLVAVRVHLIDTLIAVGY